MSEKKPAKGELKVVAAYDGGITSTAKKIGMSVSYVKRVLTYSWIKDLIRQREESENLKDTIADRQERQEFWSSVERGEPQVVDIIEKLGADGKPVLDDAGKAVMVKVMGVPSMKDRLRAAELLGRSNADFVDRLQVSDADKGVPKEITDNMDQKEATNIYMDMLKPGHA